MSEKSTGRWRLYLLTLLGAFVIVAVAGIRNAKQRGEQLDAALADQLAYRSGLVRYSDPGHALELLDSAFAFDSTRPALARAALDLFFSTEYHPVPRVLATGKTAATASPNGRFWAWADGTTWTVHDLDTGRDTSATLKEAIVALAVQNAPVPVAIQTAGGLQVGGDRQLPEIQARTLMAAPQGPYVAAVDAEGVHFIRLDSVSEIEFDLVVTLGMATEPRLKWSPDGAWAAVHYGGASIYLYEMATGRAWESDWSDYLAGQPLADFYLESFPEGSVLHLLQPDGHFGLLLTEAGPEGAGPLRMTGEDAFVLPGQPVFGAETGRYDVVQSREGLGDVSLVGTQRGAFAECQGGYLQRNYRGIGGSPLVTGKRWKAQFAAVDAKGNLLLWRDLPAERPYGLVAPAVAGLVEEPPRWVDGGVEFAAGEAGTIRYELVPGKKSVAGEASAWLEEGDSTLARIAGWKGWERHRERLWRQLPVDALGPSTMLYKVAPQEESLLLALRDNHSQQFYNAFAWVPLRPGYVLEVLHNQSGRAKSGLLALPGS